MADVAELFFGTDLIGNPVKEQIQWQPQPTCCCLGESSFHQTQAEKIPCLGHSWDTFNTVSLKKAHY